MVNLLLLLILQLKRKHLLDWKFFLAQNLKTRLESLNKIIQFTVWRHNDENVLLTSNFIDILEVVLFKSFFIITIRGS